MAITAFFPPGLRVLATFGGGPDDAITLGRDAAGAILVNGGAVPIRGGTPTVANTLQVQVYGQGGDDVITLDETNGALPRATLFGGAGKDVLTGGSGRDQLFGQAGNDAQLGRGGDDQLFGGAGHDTLTGGDGEDSLLGGGGNDRLVWNPGDDDDLFEGGAGFDTAEVNGGNGAETFGMTANGPRVRLDRLDPAPFSIDAGTMESFVVNMNGGDDSFSATGNLAALVQVTVDGGAGNDTILGGNGADLLLGGDGDDLVDGQQGNDVALLGAGDDTFQWDPGDGSDVVEGQDGTDTLLFNGSNGAEAFDIAANGGRARLFRDLGAITMDLDGVERIDLRTLGGADRVTVGDMAGTAVTQVAIDLAVAIGGAGDTAADSVAVNGSSGADVVTVAGAGSAVAVAGLAAEVSVTGVEAANDALVVATLGGDDRIDAATLPADVVRLTLDGGAGNDSLSGSRGADLLIGGDGDDFVLGLQGNDVAFLGAGDDLFQWSPGDGSDVVEGQDGADTLLFFGSNATEAFDIAANGGRVRLFRDVGGITMDLNDVERIDLRTLGGPDNVVVGDLAGTDVTEVAISLAGPDGGGDGAADTVTANASQGSDLLRVTGDATGVTVTGLAATLTIAGGEAGLDRLVLNGQGGNDTIDASLLEAGGMALGVNGGLGDDLLLGSAGDDLVNGGDGADTALLGAGDDSFVWNPGDDNDVVEGQDGFDTLLFNGANVGERITIAANGGRASLTRDVANVTMDLNDVEAIDVAALGGADTIVVNDLAGTEVSVVRINLAAAGGIGDGAADTIILNATAGDDVVLVFGDASAVTILGLAMQVVITGFDANDRVVINGLGGDDVVEASGLQALLKLTADGGEGDDVLIGSPGADVLRGGDGDDVLLGGGGLDILDGGPGDNVAIQGIAAALASPQDLVF